MMHNRDMTKSTLTEVTCRRCDGTGEYSYNPRDGKVCYGCMGQRVQLIDVAAEARKAAAAAKRRAAKEAGRLARVAAAEILRDAKVAELVERYPAEGAALISGLAAPVGSPEAYRAHEIRVGFAPFGGDTRTVERSAEIIRTWPA
jgi:hypothetical protein